MDWNFNECDAFTAPAEGGLSLDPQDAGNWTGGKVGVGELRGTAYGIAASAHPGLNIAALTPQLAREIRRAGYWAPNSCGALAAGVDLMVYDEDVNAGDARSARLLQGVVGVARDGVIGPVTLAAVRRLAAVDLITQLSAAQAEFYRELASFALYGRGWMARLERRTQAALLMAKAPAPV